jgi:valyl-tRNA synthetase
LIEKYGADGLRFGLLRIAPHGQDIRFDEKQIEEGRNFANKLWNAFRFRQLQGDAGAELRDLSPYSARILQRLNETIDRVEQGYADYLFTDVVQSLYDFFWSDFCDWYLEAAKAQLQSGNQEIRRNCLAVMDAVLSRVLKLLHPFMPHITEELWDRFDFGEGSIQFASINDLAVRVPIDSAAIDFAGKVYEAVSIARNLRAEYRIPSNRKARMILKPVISGDFAVLARLANAEPLEVNERYAPRSGVPMAVTPVGQIFLPLEGLIDVSAERERLGKEISKVEGDLVTVRKKLANDNFVQRAPAKVVEEHRQREADFLKTLDQLKTALEALRS